MQADVDGRPFLDPIDELAIGGGVDPQQVLDQGRRQAVPPATQLLACEEVAVGRARIACVKVD